MADNDNGNNESNERLTRIEKNLEAISEIQKTQAEKMAGFDERQERTQRHLEVLIDVVDGLIRDKRIRDLEHRVTSLEGDQK